MLRSPFTAVVAGPTGCGKTEFTKKLFQYASQLWEKPPQRVVWGYGIWQEGYKDCLKLNIEMVEGLPSLDTFNPSIRNVLVLDDLGAELSSDKNMANLFTKGSHHRNLDVIFLVQNFFHHGKEMRTITLNAHYLCLFKNPRDRSQILHLGRQLYPNKPKFLQEAYEDATSQPFSYLWLDLKADTPDSFRILTDILPTDGHPYAYLQK